MFYNERRKAQRAYKRFVLTGIKEKLLLWKNLKGKTFLGKDTFVQEMHLYLKQKKAIKEIPRIERFASRPRLDKLFGRPMDKKERREKIYTAHVKYGYTMKAIAQELDIHYSTVSKIIKNVEAKGRNEEKLYFKT